MQRTGLSVRVLWRGAPGDCAVASSFVSYLGPFNRDFRELLLARVFAGGCARMRIPASQDLRVSAFLAEEAEVGEWVLQARRRCGSTPAWPPCMEEQGTA